MGEKCSEVVRKAKVSTSAKPSTQTRDILQNFIGKSGQWKKHPWWIASDSNKAIRLNFKTRKTNKQKKTVQILWFNFSERLKQNTTIHRENKLREGWRAIITPVKDIQPKAAYTRKHRTHRVEHSLTLWSPAQRCQRGWHQEKNQNAALCSAHSQTGARGRRDIRVGVVRVFVEGRA